MKQYLLSVHMVEGEPMPSEAEIQKQYAAVAELNAKLIANSSWVFGGGLFPADTATVVRERNGEIVTSDGPFAESKEHIGGFWIVKAIDLDAALAIAGEATVACARPVEVRPFQDDTPE
jgi:hypothetical protein